ncbi:MULTISPECIES: hypothetical protein [unclassified Romboutsia]|uniref:hypothetical protein n=1 Tax=unclassified Romboutsia TaxID=2626894 RepID=UPI000821FB55|nr:MULTISPECIES: hypothetical protein [unclassified Romboutsia]SCI40450.1 Uncharacterised protein [uncultured Clostridium sp.]
MIKKFSLFRKRYNKKNSTSIFKGNILSDENLSYDDYDDTLFLDQDIYYDNDFYDFPLDNKSQIDFYYDMDDYDYIE